MSKFDKNEHLLKYIAIISANIKRLRGGMSEDELANRAKIARGTIQRINKGKPPSLLTLIKLAEVFGINPADLFITDIDRGEITYKHKLLMEMVFKDKIKDEPK